MTRKKHPNKHIEKAIQQAEEKGWRVLETGKSSHAWGRLLCPETSRFGCQISIWSTPRNPENHAKQIISAVEKCEHGGITYEDL